MSLRLFAVVTALWMGSTAFANTITEDDRLAYRMHREGIRQDIQISDRADLKDVFRFAAEEADELDLNCRVNRLMEVQLVDDGMAWLAGYEAVIVCVDAPSFAEGLYFDTQHAFLGRLAY